MNMKTTFYRRHKFFSQINKSSSNFYGSPTFRKFIRENTKIEKSKIDSPFSINYDLNHIHRRLLHSKIKTNPKYNQLEIECYSFKKPRKDIKSREFFLTTNKNKTVQKSRNNIKKFKINDIDENTEILKSKNRKYDTIYPLSSSISRDKNIFTLNNSNRYLNDFIRERRLINKLRYIHKIKYETKEKKENEISCGIKLMDIHQQSLLDTKELLHKFEIEQNHYNRHLFNDLMMNKQILLKLKIKKSQLEGKVLNLNRKIDDLKGKSYIAKEYKDFLFCVKNQVISIDKYKSETLDDEYSKDESNINSIKRKFIPKKTRIFAPIMRKNTMNAKNITGNRKNNKLNTLKDRKINKKLIKRASFQEKQNSDTLIFESPYEFKYQMKYIENKLIQLIKKKNKIEGDVIQLKILKEKELHSCKKNANIDSAIKLYEELLNNYKENNNDLQSRLNSLLIKQKDNLSLNNLVYNKVKEILINIKSYSKELKSHSEIFDRVKSVLYKNKIKYKNYKNNVTFEGIIIFEQIISVLSNEIDIYSKNPDGLNIIKKLRLKIEKDKKFYARQSRDNIVNKFKLNLKIIEKMNKICFTSRKVPEKINFSKRENSEKKNE